MSARERRWNELQDRWAQGEILSVEEERERREYAEQDPLARRELELFDELRARAQLPEPPTPESLLARALQGAMVRPRLRLVPPQNDDEQVPVTTTSLLTRPWRMAGGALLLALGVAATVTQLRLRPPVEAPVSALRTLPLADSARAELALSAGEVLVSGRVSPVGERLLRERDSVSTGDGRACFTIDPGVDVCLAEHSSVELDSLVVSHIRVSVTRGTALASLTPRATGSSFSVVAGDVTATAHGTTYAVRSAQEEAEVIVLEGSVEVARDGAGRELIGEHSRVVVPRRPAAVVRTPIGRSEEAKLLALRATHELWSTAAVGMLEIAAGPQLRHASIDGKGPLPLPLQIFAGAGAHHVSWRDAAGAETSSWVELTAGETRRLAPLETPIPSPSEPERKPSAPALLERARHELARARPHQALALYQQLRAAYPRSAEARTVLVTMGKLELELGQPQRALNHFELYLRGGGSLTPEALAGRARTLRALGRTRDERRAIERYLAAQPDGFEAPSFSKRLRELAQP